MDSDSVDLGRAWEYSFFKLLPLRGSQWWHPRGFIQQPALSRRKLEVIVKCGQGPGGLNVEHRVLARIANSALPLSHWWAPWVTSECPQIIANPSRASGPAVRFGQPGQHHQGSDSGTACLAPLLEHSSTPAVTCPPAWLCPRLFCFEGIRQTAGLGWARPEGMGASGRTGSRAFAENLVC